MASSEQAAQRRKRKHRSDTTPIRPQVAVAPDPVLIPDTASVMEFPDRPDTDAAAAMPLMDQSELTRERHRGWLAAVCGAAVVVLTIAAVPVAASGPRILAPSGSNKALLLGAAQAGDAQVIAMWMRVASVLLVIPLALFMYGAVKQRNPASLKVIPIVGIVAFIIVGASTALGFFEVRDAAHVFVASGARTNARAQHLLTLQRDHHSLRVADIAQAVGGLLFGLWISVVSYDAMRIGLLSRFLGIFGVGAGLTTVIGLPIGPALFIGWLASVSCLACGYWPGGRPPAWDAGRVVSWSEVEAVPSARGSLTRR